ncbi:hypothetical protein AOLI_G00234190 [Acnodon oligacanthus]
MQVSAALIPELVSVCEPELRMKILLIFTLFLISVGGGESETVTGYSGGGVLIKCRYETQYTSNQKYFCKDSWLNCADEIRTGDKNEWINRGRFSLFDDTRAAQFWVLITELTVEDSGTYLCGVDIDLAIDVYTAVELKVEEDTFFEKNITETAHAGGSVNISCTYPQSHSRDPKFLCRRAGSADCSYETSVKESRRWINEGKLHLHDDGKQIFTVTINSLTEGDSGEYWCGAESDWTSDHGYKVYITQINLRVTVPTSTQSRSIMGSSSHEAAPGVPVYEEIKDISNSDAGASTVYSAAQLPTNPSEPSQMFDDNVQLPSSCHVSNPVYASAQLPSNSPDQVIYSAVQLPTIPSDSSAIATQPSAGKSAECPTYATVNFSRKASRSTDTVTTATINKETDTVKHES